MIVTRIEEVSKTRSRIFIDGEFAFVLYKGELRKYSIRENAELDETAYREINEKILPKRAKLRVMNLLQSRQYTEKQLMDKLLFGGYTKEVSALAIDYVKSFHYVDDKQYIRNYIACHMSRMSRKEMEQKLFQKGIGKELVAEVFAEQEAEGVVLDETELILSLLQKKHFSGEAADEKEKQRILGYFHRKGFSVDKVRHVMEDSFT